VAVLALKKKRNCGVTLFLFFFPGLCRLDFAPSELIQFLWNELDLKIKAPPSAGTDEKEDDYGKAEEEGDDRPGACLFRRR
jgi:hypothetical protein